MHSTTDRVFYNKYKLLVHKILKHNVNIISYIFKIYHNIYAVNIMNITKTHLSISKDRTTHDVT